MQNKECGTCKVSKPITAFAPTKQQLMFGVKSVCRDCEREYRREWAKKNPVRVKESQEKHKSTNRDKIRAWNRDYAARMRKERPERLALYEQRARFKREYGVTMEWREQKIAAQGNLCAICGKPPAARGLCIDHCHKTGQVRDLLCSACNTALHKMEQDIEWVRTAEAYLRRHDAEPDIVASHPDEEIRKQLLWGSSI